MKIKIRQIQTGFIAGLLGFALANAAYSDGYRNPPPTAEGIGKSGANMVFVDDASAISYNPANLALQTNSSLVVAATFARTENKYTLPALFGGSSFESDGDWTVLPNIYYSQPVGDGGIVVGLGITSPYGQGITWDKTEFGALVAVDPVPYDASIMLVNFNPTIAFKLGEAFSLGIGADIMYSELELNALFPAGAPNPPNTLSVDGKGEGDGWGIGGNAGLTWDATERQRVALTYRSQVDIDYEGDFSLGGSFEAPIKYPGSFGLGYGIALTEDIRIETLLEWVEWSVNDSQTLTVGGTPQVQQNNWDDTFTFGLGGDWQLNENWVVRAGYAFIESPIPDETITPLLPDADRHALSLGAGYSIGGHTIDLAYTFSIYDDRTSPITGAAPGTYEIDSDLLGLTYSYSF